MSRRMSAIKELNNWDLSVEIRFIEREVEIKNGNKFSGCDILTFEWIE